MARQPEVGVTERRRNHRSGGGGSAKFGRLQAQRSALQLFSSATGLLRQPVLSQTREAEQMQCQVPCAVQGSAT